MTDPVPSKKWSVAELADFLDEAMKAESGKCIQIHRSWAVRILDALRPPLAGLDHEPEPTHFAFLIKRPRDKEAWPTIFASRDGAEGYEHRASEVVPVCLAQPPGAGQ